jgi:archaellum component FlaC
VQTFGDSTAIIEDLKSQMEELLEEVQELATRNEELSSAQEADAVTVRDLEDQVVDYKKKYERAKTELRNLKGW